MMSYAVPIIFVILTWWISTGVVLWLAGGNESQNWMRLVGMTVLCGFGFIGAYVSSSDTSAFSPYLAFVSALAVWAWVEFTFLTGKLTGSRKTDCPETCSETERFKLAFLAISHHEYALVSALIIIGGISLAGGQMMAFATFLLLWLMRISAKLTLFSGAPKFSLELMPQKLAHLPTYFRHDRVSWVFWVSTTVSTIALFAAVLALATGSIPAERIVPTVILATLLSLAVLEHWFMVLPVADSALWRWAVPNSAPSEARQESRKIER